MRDLLRSAATHVGTVLPAPAAWIAGLPWPAVFALILLGLAVSTSLTWIRLHQHQVEEDHRHDEIKTVLAHQALSPEVTAIITALRTSTPRNDHSTRQDHASAHPETRSRRVKRARFGGHMVGLPDPSGVSENGFDTPELHH